MIPRLVSVYAQKSAMFMYPLLQIRRRGSINPIGTYLQLEGRNVKYERALFVLHPLRTDPDFRKFENTELTKSPCFREILRLKAETIYIYDMASHARDYDFFMQGKYSMMSEAAKSRIMTYQREPLRVGQEPSKNAAYMQTFLHPQDYYGIYADLLWERNDPTRRIGMDMMVECCELCNPPDMNKERLVVRNNKVEVLYSLR